MTKPRLTYVGHSYHRKTGSTLFLQDLLATAFEVTTLWDESWQAGAPPLRAETINATRPEYLVLFQQLPKRSEYARLHCRNVTWIPMHDGIAYGTHWPKMRPAGFKVLCFCRKDRDYFAGIGYDALHVQYAPSPIREHANRSPLSVFFWVRHNEIDWGTLKSLLGAQRPDRVVLRVAPDPGHAPGLPTDEDVRDYSVEVHHGWMDGGEYRRLLAGCSLFMASRPREGIGQALLDARAHGLVAIAPDLPTMNEYLRHGVNGYLYDPAALKPIDFSTVEQVRERSLADLAAAHESWVKSEPAVIDFVRKPARRPAFWWLLRARIARN